MSTADFYEVKEALLIQLFLFAVLQEQDLLQGVRDGPQGELLVVLKQDDNV